MKVLSNLEFEKLTEDQSPRLKMLAKKRCEANPKGFLQSEELSKLIQLFMYSGDHTAASWLQNLQTLSSNGELTKVRQGSNKWEIHALDIKRRVKAKELPLDLFDHVMIKDSGKRGTVVDYLPETETYLVALDPFQLVEYSKEDILKTATKVKKG
jgi:hypothetical protein